MIFVQLYKYDGPDMYRSWPQWMQDAFHRYKGWYQSGHCFILTQEQFTWFAIRYTPNEYNILSPGYIDWRCKFSEILAASEEKRDPVWF